VSSQAQFDGYAALWCPDDELLLDRPALLAPGRRALTYADLRLHVSAVAGALAAAGLERSARVATVLPAGAASATAFLGVASAGVCAPLNPGLSRAELNFLLDDLSPAGVVVAADLETSARDVATRLRVPIVDLAVSPELPAGHFELDLSSLSSAGAAPTAPPRADDVALVLHTSGTTGRPKLVPLTHGNLRAAAANVATTMRLQSDDRCLNVMPLFHIHGLVTALLASLHAGASVVCTPGLRPDAVVSWIRELHPTWYTAVPTIHYAMLDAARRTGASAPAEPWPFRLIRSSSAALAPRLMAELEEMFGAPVIEAYGMTEAAHQIASNPLPPKTRKPRSVGTAAGPAVAIMRGDGQLLGRGVEGEIVIKGPTVTAGYADAPEANDAAFSGGWFRTGNLGVLDDDDYLVITGRSREMINRGGEKIAPREIDDALLQHPDVVQAVTFAVPHPRLGEEVSAAVVLAPGSSITKGELRTAVAERLASFKVPRRIVLVDELPTGPTGKLQRVGMAERLGIDGGAGATGVDAPHFVAPRDELEAQLAATVQEVLMLDDLPSMTDDIFDLGADSLHVVELVSEIEDAVGRPLPERALLDHASVEKFAIALRDDDPSADSVRIVAVQPSGTETPLFCLVRTGSLPMLRHFAAALGPSRPVHGIAMPSMYGRWRAAGDIEDLARDALAALRERRPDGPCCLFGHSFGGAIIYEIACQLVAAGQDVELVVLADTPSPSLVRQTFRRGLRPRHLAAVLVRRGPRRVLRCLPWPVGSWGYPREYLPGTRVRSDPAAAARRERRYHPGPFDGRVAIVKSDQWSGPDWPDWLGWDPHAASEWQLHRVSGSHDSMLGEPHVHDLAATVVDCLARTR
jgi:oxalate---CoA ligase